MERPPTSAPSERHAHSFGSTTPTLDVSQPLRVHGGGDGDRDGVGDRDADGVGAGAGDVDADAAILWQHRLSASFSAIAEQIAAASQALALVPPTRGIARTTSAASTTTTTTRTTEPGTPLESRPGPVPDLAGELAALRTRLETIEHAQSHLAARLDALHQEQESPAPETRATDSNARFEAVEKAIEALSEMVRLDQTRLPARLHNAGALVMKASLKAPVAANGKPAPGFPATRGEFEHITKERYEALLKAYNQPTTGDTASKRDRLRAFAGIPGQ